MLFLFFCENTWPQGSHGPRGGARRDRGGAGDRAAPGARAQAHGPMGPWAQGPGPGPWAHVAMYFNKNA